MCQVAWIFGFTWPVCRQYAHGDLISLKQADAQGHTPMLAELSRQTANVIPISCEAIGLVGRINFQDS